jgi:methylase of polypeptide subunit release factors
MKKRKTSSQTSFKNFLPEDSLNQVADRLVKSTNELMRTASSEEDLRIGFEKALDPIREVLGIKVLPKYEKSIYKSGRSDSLHGQVIIEYENPNSFKSKKWVDHAFEQLIGYIKGEAEQNKDTLFLFDPKLVGVGFDGKQIFFVNYQGDKRKAKVSLASKDFILNGPYEFSQASSRTLLTYLRVLSRSLLTAENLANVFGPQSSLAVKAVSAFADSLENWDTKPRVRTFFNEWKRLFGIVYGEQFTRSQEEEAKKISQLYQVGKEIDFQELLFSVHTYFVFIMKLITAELLTISEIPYKSSFSYDLTHIDKASLISKLEEIEEGGVYAKRGITNFLEGDFFRWYLDAFSPRLEEAIREIARALSDFEPATSSINPDSTKDLLKKLYQYIVPQEVRHKLGEYYTPDWLAELVLNEVGYDGDTSKRLIDPACGSGTFIVLAIKRAIENGKNNKLPRIEIVKRVVSNITGFDLNPLAIIASRTNFLFALGDLVSELESFEIPIYLADSVLWPESKGQMELGSSGDVVPVNTSVETFSVPAIWVKDKGFLMKLAAPIIEEMVKHQYTVTDAIKRFKSEGLVFPPHESAVEHFYNQILNLEQQGKNGIWARFLKNAFAPMIAGEFDFVVGNPPWIRWGYLSQEYRNATLEMWKSYGLFSLKGHAARLGGGEKDFSMLFTYTAIDHYLSKKGKLGFLITQEVFKSKGAGEGFRRFRLGSEKKSLEIKVLKAHDLVTVQPFEGAANKTAAIFVKKDARTEYPLPYTVWNRKKGVGKIPTDTPLTSAMLLLEKKKLVANPIGKYNSSWRTTSTDETSSIKTKTLNLYKAYLGARVEPYGVFWLEIKQVLSNDQLLICNLHEKGKRKVQLVEEVLESDLIYPIVRGSDIERWITMPRIYSIICQDIKTRAGYNESLMRQNWPRTYGYLTRFKEVLIQRAAYKKYHDEKKNPFYSQYNISDYTFSNYKVVWKRMANDLVAAVISQHKTPFGYKLIIPTDTTSLIACNYENEAHYICSILNSISVRNFIKSYSSAGRGFGAPSIMEHVGIPKYDEKNNFHKEISESSKKLHKLKTLNQLETIPELEKQNDELIKMLFKI